MSFIDVFAIAGAIVSLGAAAFSFLQVKSRAGIERELRERIISELMIDNERLKELLNADLHGEIKREVLAHNDMYYSLILKVIDELPGDKRSAVYGALAQESKKGSVAYMSKLLKGSLRVIGAAL